MSWLDGVFFLLVPGLSFFGFRKGIIHIVVVISSWLAGIAAAAALAGPAGGAIARFFKMPGGLSATIAAVLVFFLAVLAVRGAGLLLKKLASLLLPGADKTCGLAFGFFLALVITVLTSVFLSNSPGDSAAGNLYDESFIPGFIIRTLERAWPESRDPGAGNGEITRGPSFSMIEPANLPGRIIPWIRRKNACTMFRRSQLPAFKKEAIR